MRLSEKKLVTNDDLSLVAMPDQWVRQMMLPQSLENPETSLSPHTYLTYRLHLNFYSQVGPKVRAALAS